jgi:hypothetical protein
LQPQLREMPKIDLVTHILEEAVRELLGTGSICHACRVATPRSRTLSRDRSPTLRRLLQADVRVLLLILANPFGQPRGSPPTVSRSPAPIRKVDAVVGTV